MGENSKIEWTHHTFNPWWGCVKVSEGCDNCYAEGLAARYQHQVWGKDAPRRFFGDKHWAEPLKWNREAEKAGERRRVFCGSMCDWAEGRPDQRSELEKLYPLIEATEWLDWLLLTKRPGAIPHLVPARWLETPPPNVWYGTSVENQEQANRRIPQLLKVPAAIRFLSCEPLLGPVDLLGVQFDRYTTVNVLEGCGSTTGPGYRGQSSPNVFTEHIHWIIAGGESGPGARPMHPNWARGLRDQCQFAGVPYHFKQWGEHAPANWQPGNSFDRGGFSFRGAPVVEDRILWLNVDGTEPTLDNLGSAALLARVGKRAAGRELDGRTWDEFPQYDRKES